MKLEEAGLSLKQRTLSGLPMGNAILDHIIKLAVTPKETQIQIARVTSFDGISLRNFDPNADVRNRMTIRRQGKVSQSPGSGLKALAEESLDASTKMIGIGSALQLRKIGQMLLKQSGLIEHDGTAKYKASLKLNQREIGEAVYTIYKYHSLKDLPESITNLIPESEHKNILGTPALITKALVDVDLTNAPVTKEGFVQIRLGENMDIGHLSRDHGGNVILTAFYDVSIGSFDETVKEITTESRNDTLSLDLGQFEYQTIKTARNKPAEE